MKFKIGDKVKVINCDNAGTDCKNFNKVSTITDIISKMRYPYKLKGITEAFREEELELVERQFKKLDLKDGDLVTYRNGEKRIKIKDRLIGEIDSISCYRVLLERFTEELKFDDRAFKGLDIIKIERPTKYETVFKRAEDEKREILNETEKEYLKAVINPFKKKVKYIAKADCYKSKSYESIEIGLENDDCMLFPDFEKGMMYKGMELGKRYTLEELGI